jgi:subtilisin family serine protease
VLLPTLDRRHSSSTLAGFFQYFNDLGFTVSVFFNETLLVFDNRRDHFILILFYGKITMARLDVELDSLLIKRSLHEKNPAEAAYFVDPEMLIHVSVQFSGDFGPLRDAGFVAKEVYGNLAYGTINVETLENLDKLPSVISVEKQRNNAIQLDDSIPDIKANNIWSRSGDSFSGYTGRDVVVGIIDTGIDFRHKNFIKPDGTTRIWSIWDQTIIAPVNPPQAGEMAPLAITTGPFVAGLGYGVEYTKDEINATLNTENPAVPVRHRDEDGHGTHVAGIAAGNGKQAGGCHGEYHYIGVAPEALLVIVRLWGLTKGDKGENQTPPANPPLNPPSPNLVADALRYIFNVAQRLVSPVVINCSFGLFSELMDGSSSTCQDVNNLLNNNTNGRAVVWGAGNDGDSGFHATGTVPASGSPPFELGFKIYGSDTETRSLAIVYSGSNLEVQVTSPVGGANGTVSWVSLGATGSSATANGTITGGTAGSVTVTNRANRIGIVITPPTSGVPAVSGNNIANTATANWKIELRNTTATLTAFDAFCLYGSSHDRKSPKFLNHTTSNITLTDQATGAQCITVGSYAVGGQLAPSSGRGPTLDSRTKPDLCAPGVDITSTGIVKDRAGDLANCCCECCQDWYVGKGGTSMAAPHVTGGIALMLHKNPNLTHTDIKTRLTGGSDGRPGDAPPADIPGWGSGRLSVMNTVNPIPEVNPPIPIVAAPAADRHPLLDQFLDTDFGQIYYDLGLKYFREIYDLINTNKRVATAWHRNKGPVWTRLALNAFYDHDFKIPLTAGGLHFTQSVDQFLVMLKRYASPELQTDLVRFEPHIHLLQEGMTISELAIVLGNQPLPILEPVNVGS